MKSQVKINSSLGKLLLVRILLISTIATTIFTGFSFYIEYNKELDSLNERFLLIGTSAVPALTTSVWNIEDDEVNNQLNGILLVPAFINVQVINEKNEVIFNVTKKDEIHEALVEKKYPLIVGKSYLGNLKITATKYHMYQKLKARIIYFFFSQLIKTLIVSSLILLVFSHHVTSHLNNICKFISDPNLFSGDKYITKEKGRDDKFNEIDFVIYKFNKVLSVARNTIKEQNINIEEHKMTAINQSKLASLGEMAAGIAHEINNPLAIIYGNCTNLKRLVNDNSKDNRDSIRNKILNIDKSVIRITSIIKGLQFFSRDSTHDDMTVTLADEIITDTIGLCNERFKKNHIELSYTNLKINEDLMILCRPSQVSQVLLNIINNAYDAVCNLDERWVRITLSISNNKTTISIVDSGKGIQPALIEKIFLPFFTTKAIGKGTGLGMSLSQKIMEQHNGEITVNQENINTEFLITFPSIDNKDLAA